jgi:2-dehydropantoate 2-reductase
VKQIGSIAVIGAGAVGLYYGGRLAHAGHEVHFYTRSDGAALRVRGLSARSHHGDFCIPADSIHAYDELDKMPKVDWVISALKSTARTHYRELIAPLVGARTQVVALQNGLGNEEELARHFGAENVLGAIAYVCIHRTASGVIHHSAQGDLKVGEFGRPVSDRVRLLVDAMREAKILATAVEDLRYHRWHKQVWNIAFNGLGAARDLDCAQLLASEPNRQLVRAVMEDVVRAAAAVGVRFDDGLVDFQISRTAGLGSYKTSMHLDRLAGRPMEIEAILGEPIRQAEAAGVTDLPALKGLYAELREINERRAAVPNGKEERSVL